MSHPKHDLTKASGLSGKRVFILLGIAAVIGVGLSVGLKILFDRGALTATSDRIPVAADVRAVLQRHYDEATLKGAYIISVDHNRTAEKIGLRANDIILSYNGILTPDNGTLGDLIDSQANRNDKKEVPIVYMRDWIFCQVNAPVGLLGVELTDFNFLRDQFAIARQSKDKQFITSLINRAEKSKDIDKREIDGLKICLLLDEGGEADKERLAEVDKMIANMSNEELAGLGTNWLLRSSCYHGAAYVFQRYLEKEPNDLNIQLNLASSFTHLDQWDEADKHVDYVLKKLGGLSPYGYSVAYNAKARAALGRKDYAAALKFFRQSIDQRFSPDDSETLLLYMLAAAGSKDQGQFNSVSDYCRQIGGEELARYQYHQDAVAAYILALNNEREKAIALVQKWKDDADAVRAINSYWLTLPAGSEVLTNWNSLVIAANSR